MSGFENEIIVATGIDLTGASPPSNQLGTDGFLLIGSTAGNPNGAALTSTASTLTVTNGSGSINLDITAPLGIAYGGTGAVTLTDHGILLGSGTSAITATAVPTNGQLLIGSTGADPVLATLTDPAAGITTTGGAGTITIALADDLAGVEGMATTGLVSRTAADTWIATSVTQHAIIIGAAGEVPTNLGPLTNGQLVIGNTGNAPSAASLASADSTVTITAGAGTIDLSVLGGGLVWSVETGGAVAGVVNHGYITNLAGGVTVTLPNTAAVGSVIRICGMAGLWVLAQNAGETVYFGSTNTTTGVGGSLTATNAGDCVELVCIVANVDWRVLSSIGNITVT